MYVHMCDGKSGPHCCTITRNSPPHLRRSVPLRHQAISNVVAIGCGTLTDCLHFGLKRFAYCCCTRTPKLSRKGGSRKAAGWFGRIDFRFCDVSLLYANYILFQQCTRDGGSRYRLAYMMTRTKKKKKEYICSTAVLPVTKQREIQPASACYLSARERHVSNGVRSRYIQDVTVSHLFSHTVKPDNDVVVGTVLRSAN